MITMTNKITMKQYITCLLVCFLFYACSQNKSEDKASKMDTADTKDIPINNSMGTKDMSEEEKQIEVIRFALWNQYDSIEILRKDIPDSIANCQNRDERRYYNLCDAKLEHMQSDIRNQSDSILLLQLRAHTASLNDVIVSNAGNLKRIERFTNTLKDVSFGISKTVEMSTMLISRGIIKPRIPASANN